MMFGKKMEFEGCKIHGYIIYNIKILYLHISSLYHTYNIYIYI